MTISINVISVSLRRFTVTCTSNGGRALDITVTGPNGMVTTGAISAVGTPGRTGNDRFSATTNTITGVSNGDFYWCTASNGVATNRNNGVILRGDYSGYILHMCKYLLGVYTFLCTKTGSKMPKHALLTVISIINPWCTCTARVMVVAVCVCVCLSVYLSVTTLAVAWRNFTLKLRYD